MRRRETRVDSNEDLIRIKEVREAGYFSEVMTAEPSAESDEENGFGMDRLGFPTERRPTAYRRAMKTKLSPDFEVWLETRGGCAPVLTLASGGCRRRRVELKFIAV